MRVLDLAGRGEPAVRAAHRVGPTGVVVGVDISEGLLQMAAERAAREGVSNLELRTLNAEKLEGIPISFPCDPGTLGADVPRFTDYSLICRSLRHGAQRHPGRGCVGRARTSPVLHAPEASAREVHVVTANQSGGSGYVSIRGYSPAPARLCRRRVQHRSHRRDGSRRDGGRVQRRSRRLDPCFRFDRLLNDLPEQIQQAWEADLAREIEPLRRERRIRLGGVTRIIVAVPAEWYGSSACRWR